MHGIIVPVFVNDNCQSSVVSNQIFMVVGMRTRADKVEIDYSFSAFFHLDDKSTKGGYVIATTSDCDGDGICVDGVFSKLE